MKNLTLFVCLLLVITACKKVEFPPLADDSQNKIALLAFDYKSHDFKGGTEFVLPEDSDAFTISSIYNSPGNFGSVELYYTELDTPIFKGGIIWSGRGERSYPENIQSADSFAKAAYPLTNPADGIMKGINEAGDPYELEKKDKNKIWKNMRQLQVTADYRSTNPNGTIFVFLYTPSVGTGNPAEWEWYVFFKN